MQASPRELLILDMTPPTLLRNHLHVWKSLIENTYSGVGWKFFAFINFKD